MVRDDVRPVAGIGEDPVHALLGADVLAQGSHVHIAEDGGVERVAAQMGRRRGVRRLPLVVDLHLGHGEGAEPEQVTVGRMDHHGRGQPLEEPGLDHEDLAAAALLGRRAQDAHPSAGLVSERRGGQASTQSSCRDHVVAARVADPRERVVLQQDADIRPVMAGRRHERRLEVGGVAARCESLGLEHLGQQVVGVTLLEAGLGLGPDPVGDVEEHLGATVDLVDDTTSQVGGACVVRTGRGHEETLGVGHAGCSRTILPTCSPERRRSSALG